MATMSSRPPVATTAAALGVTALAAGIVAAVATKASAPLALGDPGPFVRWGVIVTGIVANLAAFTVLGLLAMAAFIVPERRDTDRRVGATRLAGLIAVIWATAAILLTFLAFANLAGVGLNDPNYLRQFFRFVIEIEVTRIDLIVAGIALVVAIGAALATRRAPIAWMFVGTLIAIVLPALTGHTGGSASHETAVNSLGIHFAAVAAWVGGLAALVLLRGSLGRDLGVSVARYSTVALWAYAALVVSGIQQTWVRVGSIGAFGTAYGIVVLVKIALTVALGVLGWQQRRVLTERLSADPGDGRAFARLAVTELALMGVASGLAVTLAGSAPPIPDSVANPSLILSLTGYPDPGPMTTADWITSWRIEWLFLAIALLAIGLYAAGVRRLHRRGDSWPWGRTVSWVAGWLVWIYASCGAPDIWGRVLFSVHMVMHMAVAMLAPILLVPGAPITLLLRAIPARTDKTWGVREVFLHVVHSRAMRILANPVVAASLFFFSLAAFYWSPLFYYSLTTHYGHLMMMAHFLLTGYLFTWVLIGIDPGPPRWSPLMLLVVLFATISFHAFFGVGLTESTTLLASDFFGTIHLPWMTDPMADQYTAGEIAWGIGEVPTLALAILVARNWVRQDSHERHRIDRQADRDGDAERTAYNEFLAKKREQMSEKP